MRVGRGDRAEVERVVDDRHEEVGRRDDRLVLVELVDGRVVRRLDADQQRRRQRRPARRGRGSPAARRARSCSRSRRRARTTSGGAADGSGAFTAAIGDASSATAGAVTANRHSSVRSADQPRVGERRPLQKPHRITSPWLHLRAFLVPAAGVASRQRQRSGRESCFMGVDTRHAATATGRATGETGFEADGYRAPRLFPQSRRLPVGLPGPHARSRIHPADRRGPLRRRVLVNWKSNVFPGHPRPHLRSPVRARVPPRPRRGRLAGASRAPRPSPSRSRSAA